MDDCSCAFGFSAMTDAELDAIANTQMTDMSDDELAHFYDVYHDRGRLDVLFDTEHPVECNSTPDLKIAHRFTPISAR